MKPREDSTALGADASRYNRHDKEGPINIPNRRHRSTPLTIDRIDVAHGSREPVEDHLAVEEPLEIRLDGKNVAVVMRSPGNDEELAVGFLYTEAILKSHDELGGVELKQDPKNPELANVVEVTSAEGIDLDNRGWQRNFVSASSCGLCGKLTIESVRLCLGAQLAISVHNCPVLTDSRFPMSIFKRTQRKYVKKAYRVRNWREYEAGLRNRGSLTVWISLTAGKLVNWDAPRPRRRKPGRQRKYSNHAIETAVTLGMVFHLSSRQSEGLLRSLFALMKLDNDVPDHTTISRRKAKLGKVPFYQDKQKTPLHILIDSSGLAVHAGQLRRAQKSRDYRKLHLCVDEQSGEVVAGELTSKRARDSSRVASLVGQIDSPISSARADTAYDASGVYEAIENHSAHRSPRVLILPRKGAQLASGPASSRQRNRNIAAQARLGKRKWHTESGYSKRSKVETTFHRYKAIVGSAMRARGLAAQRVEARIGCKILNTMTALGMPDSEMTG